jgi:hypothetical protein
MSLADYYEDGKKSMGGKWMTAGIHVCKVCDVKKRVAGTGNECVIFRCINVEGQTCDTQSLWFSEKAIKFLAGFAIACGMTKQQMAAINPNSIESFNILIGSVFVGTVQLQEDSDKYHEISFWKPATEEQIKQMQSVHVSAGKFPDTPTAPARQTATANFSDNEVDDSYVPF